MNGQPDHPEVELDAMDEVSGQEDSVSEQPDQDPAEQGVTIEDWQAKCH